MNTHRKRAIDRLEQFGAYALVGGRVPDQFAVVRKEVRIGRIAQPSCVGTNRLEHRQHIALRLADHAQNVAGRCLLLERLGQVAVA